LKYNDQNLYISVESLRNRITNRLIPVLFIALLISLFLSLARIPSMGFRPLMLLHLVLVGAMAILFVARNKIRPDASALIMVGMLSALLIIGVAALGLLSTTFVLGPIIALYLMLLGHRKSAYMSVVVTVLYLSIVGYLFVSGIFSSAGFPDLYVRSPIAWMLMIVTVCGVSIAFVAPFELVPRVLEGSEERYRQLIEAMTDGFYRSTHEGKFLEVNPAMVKILGYKNKEELLAIDIISDLYFVPEDRESPALDEKQEEMAVYRLKKKDGSEVWVEDHGRQVINDNGKVLYHEGILRDITERMRADEALRESEERFRTVYENSTIGLYRTAPDGTILLANPTLVEKLGYSSFEELAARNLEHEGFEPSYERKQFIEVMQQYGEVNGLEAAWTRKDGSVIQVRESARAIKDTNGTDLYYDGSVEDISERKQAEDALVESEQRFHRLFVASPDALLLIDPFDTTTDWPIVDCNEVACQMNGYTREELIGKSINILNTSEGTPEDRAAYVERIRREGVLHLESSHRHRDGHVYAIEISTSLISFKGQELILGIDRDITERKRAEAALQESEEQFRMVFENAFDGISIYDLDPDPAKRKLIECNERYAAMAGRSREELLRLGTTQELQKPLEGTTNMNRLNALSRGTAFQGSFSWIRPDGKDNIVEYVGAPITWQGKAFSIGIDRDVTERKQAEDKLRESETRFRQLAEAAVEGIAFTDKGILVDGNTRLATMLGYELQEMIGRPVADFIAPESVNLVLNNIRTNYQGSTEHFTQRKDGRIFPVESHSHMMKWHGKDVRVSSLLDISERRRTQEQLHKLSLAVEQSPVSIVITDTKGKIEYVNPKFTTVTGYTIQEAVGKNTSILKSGETSREEYKRLWETISAGNEWRGEFHNKKKNGELYWESSFISPVKNADNVITNFVEVKEDVTERKQAEEALRHAQKLESIGTLAGGIAHDFNNLLNAIMGQSSLALGRLPKESPAGNNIAKALKAAERAANLTQQLLAYSGMGKFITEEIDLNRLVKENAQLLKVSVPKSVRLRYELDPSILFIHGDAGQIQQVVMNLIINAGDAIGANSGFIIVRTNLIELRENETEYTKYTNNRLTPGAYVLLEVSDTGHGIKPDVLARIFDPFFTTKFTGRGLGLAAVLGIIRGHNGGLRIESEEGKGTKFEIVFPLVDVSPVIKTYEAKNEAVINGSGKTILVIDDELAVLELLRDVFADVNIKVIEASNPIEGIQLYRKYQKEISMIILDYSMPDMDGKQTFEMLIKVNKNVKVILCSGYSEEEVKSAFGEVHPVDFIKKPYKPSDLLSRVSRIIS